MRVRRVNRYYCEHCGKGGCSSTHMKKHEARCCANPNRICGMCEITTGEPGQQRPVEDLINALREGDTPKLREAAHGCPACMLAAIIQNNKRENAGTTAEGWPLGSDFQFKKERDAMWAEANAAKGGAA